MIPLQTEIQWPVEEAPVLPGRDGGRQFVLRPDHWRAPTQTLVDRIGSHQALPVQVPARMLHAGADATRLPPDEVDLQASMPMKASSSRR